MSEAPAAARGVTEIAGTIDKASPVPFYYQLRQLLERAVADSVLAAGVQIPTEASLCERYDVSRTVVRQALSDLERTGLVTRVKGKGTFVAEPKVSEFVAQSLTSLHEDLTARGERLETKVLRLEVEPVSPHVGSMLELPESEQIVLLERLRFLRGEPLVVTTAYMPYSICAPILELDMSDRSLFETYEQVLGLKLHRGSRSIEARAATGEVAHHLGVPEGSPVLAFSGVTYLDDGRPIEYFIGLHRGDRSRFETELFRPSGRPTWPPHAPHTSPADGHALELGLIGSAWHGTSLGVLEGIAKTKEIGFDSYDVFEDPLTTSDDERRAIKETCEELGLPIRSAVCIALGLVDFVPSVRRFTLDRCKAYIDQQAYFGGRNVLLVVGEYYCDLQVFSKEQIFGLVAENLRELAEHAEPQGIELAIELEPFKHAVANSVHELADLIRLVDHPAVKANADVSHLHLSGASFDDVAVLTGMIGHVHVSDCDGKVHGDMPPGRGVTPIKEYLQAILDTGYTGTVSVELERVPEPDRMVELVEESYRETARILAELGARKPTAWPVPST